MCVMHDRYAQPAFPLFQGVMPAFQAWSHQHRRVRTGSPTCGCAGCRGGCGHACTGPRQPMTGHARPCWCSFTPWARRSPRGMRPIRSSAACAGRQACSFSPPGARPWPAICDSTMRSRSWNGLPTTPPNSVPTPHGSWSRGGLRGQPGRGRGVACQGSGLAGAHASDPDQPDPGHRPGRDRVRRTGRDRTRHRDHVRARPASSRPPVRRAAATSRNRGGRTALCRCSGPGRWSADGDGPADHRGAPDTDPSGARPRHQEAPEQESPRSPP